MSRDCSAWRISERTSSPRSPRIRASRSAILPCPPAIATFIAPTLCARALPHHVLRPLVVAQATEGRVAQLAVAGPLAEAHLGDQLRLHPAGLARQLADRIGEGGLRLLELAQLRAEIAQCLLVETGADLARVEQLALLVVADQQRPELGAGALRSGETADHHLLLVGALELEPVARALWRVAAVGPLGDQPFPPLPAGLLVERLAVAVAVRDEVDRALEGKRLLEHRLARSQRQAGQV